MPIFLVSYDLNREDGPARRAAFAEAMQKLNPCRVMDNAALVHVNTGSARALLEHLRPFLDPRDRIFAVRVSPENMFYLNAYPGTNDWVARNLPAAGAKTASAETPPAPDGA